MRFYYMKENDKKALEWIIKYCNRIEEHISVFGDDEEIYTTNNTKMHVL